MYMYVCIYIYIYIYIRLDLFRVSFKVLSDCKAVA